MQTHNHFCEINGRESQKYFNKIVYRDTRNHSGSCFALLKHENIVFKAECVPSALLYAALGPHTALLHVERRSHHVGWWVTYRTSSPDLDWIIINELNGIGPIKDLGTI